LLVNCDVTFAGDLAIGESVVAKFFRQSLVMAFLGTTLSRGVRFLD